jgi:hypothetical protein
MKFLLIITIFILPVLALAQPIYEPMVGVPGYAEGGDFGALMTALYALAISIAALLAVIKIVIAGVKWMLTDIVTAKGEAKKDIYAALIGLLIVVGAVLILFVINPNILNVEIGIERIGSEIPEEVPEIYEDLNAQSQTIDGITVTWINTDLGENQADQLYIWCAENLGVIRTIDNALICVRGGSIIEVYQYDAPNNITGCNDSLTYPNAVYFNITVEENTWLRNEVVMFCANPT